MMGVFESHAGNTVGDIMVNIYHFITNFFYVLVQPWKKYSWHILCLCFGAAQMNNAGSYRNAEHKNLKQLCEF